MQNPSSKKQTRKAESKNISNLKAKIGLKKQKKKILGAKESIECNAYTSDTTSSLTNQDNKIITRFKKKALTCGICYQAIEKQGSLEICNHEFCFSCIQKWAKIENTCPLCKQRFSKIKNIWRRPYYGEVIRKKICTTINKNEDNDLQSGDIEIPFRSQSIPDGIPTLDYLLNFLISTVPVFSDEIFHLENVLDEIESSLYQIADNYSIPRSNNSNNNDDEDENSNEIDYRWI